MGKTRLSKKIRDTKRTFHAKTGTIKERKGKDLTKAEEIKKWWQEYTEVCKAGEREVCRVSRLCAHAHTHGPTPVPSARTGQGKVGGEGAVGPRIATDGSQ